MSAPCPAPTTKPWASPAGRLVLAASAPRAAWLAARRTGLGASEASAILGLVSKYSSPYEVWAEKLGLIASQPDNESMEMGRLLEPIVADRWSARSGIRLRKAGLMRSRANPWQMASVDRLAECGGLVEIKTLSWRVADQWDDGQTPDHAEAQSQQQMAVTGRSHTHVVGLLDGRTMMERLVPRNDGLIEDLTGIERTFWHDYVLTGVEPPIDGSDATTDALNSRWGAMVEKETVLPGQSIALIEARAELAAQVAELNTRKAEVENHLRQLMGENTVGTLPGIDDKKVTYRRNGTLRSKQLAEELPDLVEELTHPIPAFDLDALKRDHPDVYAKYRSRTLRLPTL